MDRRFAIRVEFEITYDVIYTSYCTAIIRGSSRERIFMGVSMSKYYDIARSESQYIALSDFAKSLDLSPKELLEISHLSSDTIFVDKHQPSINTSLVFLDRFYSRSSISSPERLKMRLDRFGPENIKMCMNSENQQSVLVIKSNDKFTMGLGKSFPDDIRDDFFEQRIIKLFYDEESSDKLENAFYQNTKIPEYSSDDVDDRRKLSDDEKAQLDEELEAYMFLDEKYREMIIFERSGGSYD